MRTFKCRDQRGSVLVIVAVTLTALLGMGMIVIDVANWWVHKRHLQGQADGAALAGAQLLRAPCTSAVNGSIAQEVQRYAGTTSLMPNTTAGTPFNPPIAQISMSQGESVLGLLNSSAYPDNQPAAAGDTEANTQPCPDNAVDVKLSDKSIPYLFVGGALPHVNVHARVALYQAGSATGLFPFGVPDPTPRTVVGRLVDDSGTPLTGVADIPLTQTAPGSDPGEFDSQTVIRTVPPGNPTSPAISGATPGDYSQPPVDVRIAASPDAPPISASCSGRGESCYPQPTGGLIQLRAWPVHVPSSKDVAVIYAVGLSGAGGFCGSNGYFVRISAAAGACPVTVTVTADFQPAATLPAPGATPTSTDRAAICLASQPGSYFTGSPRGSGTCGRDAFQLQRGPDDVNGHHTWTGTVSVPNENTTTTTNNPTFLSVFGVSQAGAVRFSGDNNDTNCTTQNPCVQSPIPAQKIFSGSFDQSGYLNSVAADSYNRSQCFVSSGCPVSLKLQTHFQQLKPAASANDPLFSLRVSGSQNNQSIQCTDNSQTRVDIATGCQNPFRQWRSGSDPACSSFTRYSDMASPYPCVEKDQGVSAGQVGQGMQERILPNTNGNVCDSRYRNHWVQYPWTSDPSVPLNDHRLMPVFITRFGGFANAPPGNGQFFPVTGFALFYVTGWRGQGSNSDPCANGNPGPGATVDDTPGDTDTIVGHFVNLIDLQFTPDPGTQACDLGTLSLCVPVLTD